MKISRNNLKINKIGIPSIEIIPDEYIGEILMIHGYGGCKEEILGLSFRLSEEHYKCTCIDLRGHGENKSVYDDSLLTDINAIIDTMNSNTTRIAIGHSLGGRLALLSHADIKIGISPALTGVFSEQTIAFIKSMRQHRVREVNSNINFEFLSKIPKVNDSLTSKDLIIYGKKDVPDIILEIKELSKSFKNIHEIDSAYHGDTFIMEEAVATIKNHLAKHVNPA
jgi:esterase/lipase